MATVNCKFAGLTKTLERLADVITESRHAANVWRAGLAKRTRFHTQASGTDRAIWATTDLIARFTNPGSNEAATDTLVAAQTHSALTALVAIISRSTSWCASAIDANVITDAIRITGAAFAQKGRRTTLAAKTSTDYT